MKIVINRCYGGFGLSKAAILAWCEAKNIAVWAEKSEYTNYNMYWLVPPEERISMDEAFYSLPIDERIEYSKKCDSQRLYEGSISRTDPDLIEIVERLGKEANDAYAELNIVDIPDDVAWEIEEYDGMEWVAEVHRTWS